MKHYIKVYDVKHSYKYKNLLYSFLFRKKVSLFERWHVGGRAKKRETYGNKGGEGSQKIPYLWWCHFLNVHTFVPCPSDAILTSSVFAGLDLLYLFTQNEWFILSLVFWCSTHSFMKHIGYQSWHINRSVFRTFQKQPPEAFDKKKLFLKKL